MIVLDTTVLIFAVGGTHPLRDPCRAIIERVGDGSISATTTVEAIQEFTHVRARRRPAEDAAELARRYVDLLGPLCRPNDDDLRRGLDLFVRHERLGAFDAVLAATVMNAAHLDALVSADAAFGDVVGLNFRVPAEVAT